MHFVTSGEQITPEWLEETLRESGWTLPGVRSVDATALPGGNGYMAQTYRLQVRWDGEAEDAPVSLVAKLPLERWLHEEDAAVRRMFRREVMFHREIGPAAPLRTAKAYAAHLDPVSGAGLLVFEDLSGLQAFSDGESLSVEQVENCLSQLAALHGRYWGSGELEGMDWLAHPAVSRVDEVPQEDFRRGWPELAASGAYEMTPGLARLGDLLMERLDGVYEALHAMPETLIHTDLHQENLFFEGNGAAFIDWQLAERSPAAKDVAKLTASCLAPGTVAVEQPRLIRKYHEELRRNGVGGYSVDEMARATHLATCHYVAALRFLSSIDFGKLRERGASRTDFTSQRVLAAAGRDEVISAVEGL